MNQYKLSDFSFRLVLALLLVGSAKLSSATNYYFSISMGDDSRESRQAQNPATPWKTLDKLNAISHILKGGDSVFLKAGEKFYGSIQLHRLGSPLIPIVFTVYGKGNRPVISGLTSIISWKLYGNGIYQAKCSSCKAIAANMLLINGVQQPMGRYPNTGYLTYQSHMGNMFITDKNLKSSVNWTGAELVIRKNHWIIDRCKISSQAGTKLNYTACSSSEPTADFGYFIQGDLKTLDQFGEWYYDPSSENISVFLGNHSPASFQINVSTTNSLIDIAECQSIDFEYLSLTGAALNAIKIKNAGKIHFKNCFIDLSATDGINASGSRDFLLENSTVDHSLNDAIVLDSSCRSAVLRNNVINNTGLIPGMGKSGSGTYQAVSIFGESSLVELNDIDGCGYNAIYFGGNATTVKNNFIRNFCSVKDDGAAIYVGDWFPSVGKKIVENIILKGIGASDGSKNEQLIPVEGIYIDDNTSGVDIQSNSVASCPDAGIKIHNARDIQIENNTIFNNGIQLLIAHDNLHPKSSVRNLICKKNIFFCQTSNQLSSYIYSVDDDLGSIGSMDSNYYYGTVNDPVIKAVSNIWTSKMVVNNFSLVQWQEIYNQDRHSKKILSKITGEKNVAFEYNAAIKNKEVLVKGSYASIQGIISTDKFILRPYQSMLVMRGLQSKN